MHARVNNQLSEKMQQMFKVNEHRRIKQWKYYNYEESTDYLDVSIKE